MNTENPNARTLLHKRGRGAKNTRNSWRLNTEIDPRIRNTFRLVAEAKGETMRDAIEELMKEYIERNKGALTEIAEGRR